MLDHREDAEVIAAHEAGHVIVGLHLGMSVEGVDLTWRDNSPARTRFADGEMPRLDPDQRAALAFSGLAGQHVAGTYWNGDHVNGDIGWFLGGERPDDSSGLTRACGALEADRSRFDQARLAIAAGLARGTDWLSLADLLAQPENG